MPRRPRHPALTCEGSAIVPAIMWQGRDEDDFKAAAQAWVSMSHSKDFESLNLEPGVRKAVVKRALELLAELRRREDGEK